MLIAESRFRSGGWWLCVRLLSVIYVCRDQTFRERPAVAKRPGKGPLAEGLGEAFGSRVQPAAAARHPPRGIGQQNRVTLIARSRNDAQKGRPAIRLPAPDTRTDRARDAFG